MVKVCVKWNKEKYDIDIDTSQPVAVFKTQLFSLTMVPIERQKIMGLKGGVLKDDAKWEDVGLSEGKQLMLMGSAEEVSTAPTGVKFVEDLPQKQQVVSALPAGLTNLGNTCYMNSTLQCLKAVPELSKVVRGFENPKSSSQDTLLTKAAKGVFQELESGNQHQPVTPLVFMHAFRTAYPQFQEKSAGGVFAQQDAEESWSLFLTSLAREFHRLEESNKGITSTNANQFGINTQQLKESVIGRLFGVELVENFQCKDNPKEEPTQRIENVMKLSCNITVDTSFLFEGLKKGMEEEITKRSETLGREAVYTKKSLISSLPPYLTIQFVRFYWKAEQKTKAKIIRAVQFPFILDMFPLCTPELKEKLAPNRQLLVDAENAELEKKRLGKDDDKDKKPTPTTATNINNNDPFLNNSLKPNETGKYELIAVLTHQGLYADAGHYIGWVKKAEDKWMKYDDQDVSECNNEEIKKLFGGGQWHVAYMCIYKSISVPTQSPKITEESNTTTSTTTSMDTSN